MDDAEVLALAQRTAEAGAAGITLCDTTGMAYPDRSRTCAWRSGRGCRPPP